MGKKEIKDVLLQSKEDRRILPNVPDYEEIRTNVDRRRLREEVDRKEIKKLKQAMDIGHRYLITQKVTLKFKNEAYYFISHDISGTGILLEEKSNQSVELKEGDRVRLNFEITPGTMPEGYENKIKIKARVVRIVEANKEHGILYGLEFEESLAAYINRKKGRHALVISCFFLFFIAFFVFMMRAESVIYFKFNKWLYLYSIIAAAFLLSRYLIGMLYRPFRVNPDFTPGVTIIIPCFNEEEWIDKTILSCVNQDYPVDKLQVLVVDDASTDHSVEVIKKTLKKIYCEAKRYKTTERVGYLVQKENKGKRDALARGVMYAKHELIVFVDSDSMLDPFAIRNLVQPFQDPKMGGVSGRTDVANTYTNLLTKMQSVRYYIAFRIMKAAESYFDAVTCLSGPLSCYRKDIILEHKDEWLNQKFLGQKATFGDDRSLTNFVLRKHRTYYQDTAICATIVPNKYNTFLKQQMRWKRSWLRESIIAGSFIWKKEPFMSLFFYVGLVVPIAAPIVVVYNLIYVPITQRVFPTTFLIGLLMMAFLMSFAQLFFRKSTTWLFGMLFCIYYEAVLLWQMPIAWFTFWKSTWGTRMTPEDVKAQEKRRNRKRHVRKDEVNSV